ncbi:M56 family metallopeptidase [Cohnella soli]|uniref:M56 family metallopeptidase n=1 Tax=Cohnella soli TaxID=425005 RepID=A0ABW0HUD5_9BACL
MPLLETSLSVSILIVAILFFRWILLHKLPKMTFMFLWSVALVQLLVPVSVHSQFSIFTVLDYLSGRMFAGKEGTPVTESPLLTDGGTVSMPPVKENMTFPTEPLQIASQLSPIVWAWLIGFTLCALYFIIPHLRSRKNYKMSLPINNNFIREWQQSNRLWRKVQIRQADHISTPLTYGILRPVVLLPKALDYTDENQLALILTHEFTHIKRYDTLKKWLFAAGVSVHWFNPVVWVMYVFANRDIELSCDETVIRTFGNSTKSAYALALVSLEEKRSGMFPMMSHFAKKPIEERIISIMKTKKTSIRTMLLAITIAVSVVTVFATSARDETEAATGGDEPVAEVVPNLYQGQSTTVLMPIDLTFRQADVPMLIDNLIASKYRAIYIDNEIYVRVMNDNSVMISKDNGKAWGKYDTDDVETKDFAKWLLENDPNPGYSMKEVQSRLANGAEVKHIAFENGKEMYFIMDARGVQIELVQPAKLASVLIDGQRMMITCERLPMYISDQILSISAPMLRTFYDLLVSSNILTKADADQDYSQRMKYLKKNDTIFTVTD